MWLRWDMHVAPRLKFDFPVTASKNVNKTQKNEMVDLFFNFQPLFPKVGPTDQNLSVWDLSRPQKV